MLDSIINYFETIPSLHRTLILAGGLTLFSLIESLAPLMSLDYKRWKHAGINVFFTVTTIIVNFFLAFLLLKSSDWAVASGIGILQWIDLPLVAEIILGLLLLDLIGAYTPHWVEHHVKFLWQFHIIHHSDQNVDVTTANRHHPGESVLRFLFTIIAAVIVGAPIYLIFLYQSMSVVVSQFNHANIILPKTVNNILVAVICTPNMHHVHHHYRMPYSDSNYGNIFSFWDRLFKTYEVVDNDKLVYGLDTHFEKKDTENIWTMLKMPFQKHIPHIEYKGEENL